MNSNRQHGGSKPIAFAVALASPPILLLLLLSVLNPTYLAVFWERDTVQIGLPVLGVIVFLAAVAYPAAILGIFAVFRARRRMLGIALAVLTFVLLCLPASFLMLLAPAALQLAKMYSGTATP